MTDEVDSPISATEDQPAEHALHRRREVLVVLVRHGQSVWNAERRYQGQRGPGLTDLGHRQAEAAATFVADNFGTFDAAVASDLPRVQETRQPWSRLTGTEPVVDTRWREIDAGDWSGRLPADVKELYADEVEAFERGEDIARGGGETFAQLRSRTWQAMTDLATGDFDGLARDQPAKAIVFTHGGCIHMAAAETLDLPPMGHRWLKAPANCSVTVFRHEVGPGRTLHSTTLLDYNVATSTLG